MKKMILYVVILSLLSCNYIDNDKRMLVNDIVKNPQDIKKICYNSSFEVSKILTDSLNVYPEVYIKHFLKYNKKFKIVDEWHTGGNKDVLYVRVFVSDSNRENIVAFDFIKKNGKWILHNILLEKF